MCGYTYVMSDIHGCYDEYIKMLDLIDFSHEDKLYILGDVLDRGPKPISVLLDIMSRENVELLFGNHEYFALKSMPSLIPGAEFADDKLYNNNMMYRNFKWIYYGGDTSVDEFEKLSAEKKKEIYNFLAELPAYKEIYIDNKKYYLVHAGIEEFTNDDDLKNMDKDKFIWFSPFKFDENFFEDETKYLVFGHTPTFRIPDLDARAGNIFVKNNYIAIDCGAPFKEDGGRLGCLRLNDMKDFYV